MKNARLAVARFAVAFAAGSLLAGSAMAAPVAMLQFGSFETRDEAQTRLDLMKKKHGGVLTNLPVSIREIKLPPDDLTVYRTQAGPLVSRAAAQSICAQLASNGDECYVVETTMVAGSAAAPVVPPSTLPAADKTAAAAVGPAPAPPVQLKPIPARDPRSVAALANVSAPSSSASSASGDKASSSETSVTAASGPVDATPAKPSAQLQAALDKAIADQEAAEKAPKVEPEIKPVKDTRSFWSRANPFDDEESAAEDKPTSQTAKQIAQVAAPTAAAAIAPAVAKEAPSEPEAPHEFPPPPVMTQQQLQTAAASVVAKEEPHEFPPPPVVTQQQLQAAAASMAQPPALPVPDPVKAPTAPTPTTPIAQAAPLATPAPASAPSMDLPPPPPPLIPSGPRPMVAAQAMPPMAPPAPAPVAKTSPIGAKPVDAAHSNVNVEEAKRVPLTEVSMVPPPPEVASVPGPASPPPPPANLLPTSDLGKKTLWAQMGQFPDTQAALAFWDHYRQSHPDFPSVRVRVVSSYQAQQHGDDSKWLRVGPFARGGFISGLCNSLEDSNVDDLQCGQVMDMGVASSGNRVPGFLPPSRYIR